MARILSISSQVVRGHVGNSAAGFVLQRLGHEVWGLPTVLLSNHPGHESFGGARLKSTVLRPVLEALDLSGALSQVDAVMTGYLPTREHIFFAHDALQLVRLSNPDALFLCDPVLGEDARPGKPEGLFIDVKAAESLRGELLPHADIITPNRFELEWLAMRPVLDETTALQAMEKFGQDMVLATSIPANGGRLANVLSCGDGAFCAGVDDLGLAPHGAGDMMAALFLAGLLDGKPADEALGSAVGGAQAALGGSMGEHDINPVTTQEEWVTAAPAQVERLQELV